MIRNRYPLLALLLVFVLTSSCAASITLESGEVTSGVIVGSEKGVLRLENGRRLRGGSMEVDHPGNVAAWLCAGAALTFDRFEGRAWEVAALGGWACAAASLYVWAHSRGAAASFDSSSNPR